MNSNFFLMLKSLLFLNLHDTRRPYRALSKSLPWQAPVQLFQNSPIIHCICHFSYRLRVVACQQRNSAHVSCQTDIGDKICRDKVLQTVFIRIKWRAQLLAKLGQESAVECVSPVLLGEVQQSPGECTFGWITQGCLDCPVRFK